MPTFEPINEEEDSAPPTSPNNDTTTTIPSQAVPTPAPPLPPSDTSKIPIPPRPLSKETKPGPRVDISPNQDGGIIKRIKRKGTGIIPQLGDQVTLHYVATHGKDGVLFDSSRKLMNSGGYSFKLGSSAALKEGMLRHKGWEIALTTMQVGECALIDLTSEYAFGKLGVRQPPRPGYTVPPNVSVMYNLELVECGKSNENMTKEEKMERGNHHITNGNDMFAQKEYKKAIGQYELALQVLQTYPNVRHDVDSLNINMEEDVLQTRRNIVRCLSNVATCYYKDKDKHGKTIDPYFAWKEVLKNCDQAIWVHDGGKVNDDRLLSKILYRRSEVYLYKSETLKARNDLERAFLCAPDSKPINKLLKVTINKQKLEKKQRKDMFGGMLTSKNKNGSTLYDDKKDVDLEKMKENEVLEKLKKEKGMWVKREEESVLQMVKENYMFLLSVILLVSALVYKVVML